jgi:2-iminobutanoate/2-iminopropanoate deaminase
VDHDAGADAVVFPETLSLPVSPFSHAVEADGWIIVTGQMPTDPGDDSAALPEGVDPQT